MTPPLSVGRVAACAFAMSMTLTVAPALAQDGWPRCDRDECPQAYLNVETDRGDARLSVSSACIGEWRHVWGVNDARRTIRQWLNADAAKGRGRLCIPLHPAVDEIRITSIGGHCGYDGEDVTASKNAPSRDLVLRRSYGGTFSTILTGCHATIGTKDTGKVSFGGIALNFADGYGFGDSYTENFVYGVYDGFGSDRVRPFGVSLRAIGDFNTFHYRIDVLAGGRSEWSWANLEENGR